MPSLDEIGLVVLEEKIFKILILSYYLAHPPSHPHGKGQGPSLSKLESPSPKDHLCKVWLKLTQGLWRRKQKCEKYSTTTSTLMMTTDNWQILIRKAQTWLRWAKNSLWYWYKYWSLKWNWCYQRCMSYS